MNAPEDTKQSGVNEKSKKKKFLLQKSSKVLNMSLFFKFRVKVIVGGSSAGYL